MRGGDHHHHVRVRCLGHARDHAYAIWDANRDADTDTDRVSSELLSIVRCVSGPFASSPSLLAGGAAVRKPVHVQRINRALRGAGGDAHHNRDLHSRSEPGRNTTAWVSVCGFDVHAHEEHIDDNSDVSPPTSGADLLDGDRLPVP